MSKGSWVRSIVVAGGLATLGTGPASATDQILPGFDACTLRGAYAYTNLQDGVASFGVIRFDGIGQVEIDLRVNVPIQGTDGKRDTLIGKGEGTYTVAPSGIGVVDVAFEGLGISQGFYDFMIIDHENGLATDVFAVFRDGGINGQLVDPTWTLLAPPPGDVCG